MFCLFLGLKPDLIDYLEKKREEELAERKEKSQKLSEETSKEKSSNTSIGWESPQNMEVRDLVSLRGVVWLHLHRLGSPTEHGGKGPSVTKGCCLVTPP